MLVVQVFLFLLAFAGRLTSKKFLCWSATNRGEEIIQIIKLKKES
jgi:hypothetical protein